MVKRSPTLETLVSTKTKCIKLIFIGKITLVPVAFLMALGIFNRLCSQLFLSKSMLSSMYIGGLSQWDCSCLCVHVHVLQTTHISEMNIVYSNSLSP